jgi:hypothetical protein
MLSIKISISIGSHLKYSEFVKFEDYFEKISICSICISQ